MTAPRIVSLVPSLTELLCELGLRDALVGRTGFCVHPREALREVPKVGGTKSVDIERVRALSPTHLVVNVDENEKPTVDELARFVPEVVVTHPIAVDDNRALIERFGQLFERERQAARLVDDFDDALAALRARHFAALPVVYLIWKDPWMTVAPDTFIARMLAEAGMQSLSPGGARYPAIDVEWMRTSGARAILLSSEPYRFRDRHAVELQRMLAQGDGAGDGSDDRADHGVGARMSCLTIDGEMTSWYGSRAIRGLRYLLEFRLRLDALLAGEPEASASRGERTWRSSVSDEDTSQE